MLREAAIPLLCMLLPILQITRMAEAVEVEVICANTVNVKTGFLGIKYYSWRRLYSGSGKPMTECGEWHKLEVCPGRYTWVLRTNRNSAEEADMQKRRNKLCKEAYGQDYNSALPGNSGTDVWALFQSSDDALYGHLASYFSGFMGLRVHYWANSDGAIFNHALKQRIAKHYCSA